MTGPGAAFDHADLTGATFHNVQLNDARFRMVDLAGSDLRSVGLVGVSIDTDLWELDGLRINGVEVGPLVRAELIRREPVRALIAAATDPAGLRTAWAALEQSWASTYDRVAAMPAGTADVSVDEEWTLTQTLRHLVFATDAWLGAIEGAEKPFHPWGMPFTEVEEYIDRPVADLGVDPDADPSYAEVLELRGARVARVREVLADVSAERLADECDGPPWQREPLSVLRCLRVILNEECEHRRFAERDLDRLAHP